METAAIVLSIIGTVCICASSLMKGKDMRLILLFVFLANVFVGTSYVLTGAQNGMVSCGLGAVTSVINYCFERKNRSLPMWLVVIYGLAFFVVNIFTFTSFAAIFALLACLAFVMGVVQKSGKKYRIWTLTNAGFWLIYDIASHSYGPVVTHVFQSVIAIFGMVVHDRKRIGKK